MSRSGKTYRVTGKAARWIGLWLFCISSVGWSAETPTVEDPPAAEAPVPVARPSLAELRESLQDADPNVRHTMLDRVLPSALAAEDQAEAVSLIAAQLDDPIPDLRVRAAETLARFGPAAKSALPQMLGRIGDTEMTNRYQQVWPSVSRAIGAVGPEALPIIREKLLTEQHFGYLCLIGAVAQMGPEAASVAPLLIEQLQTSEIRKRTWGIMFTLMQIGESSEPAIPEFIKHLDDDDFNVVLMACRALASHGEKSRAAVPKLLELLDEKLISTRTHAAMALGSIGPNANDSDAGDAAASDEANVGQVTEAELRERLVGMIREKNAFSQERGLIALARRGRKAAEAAPAIEALLPRDDFSTKPEAALALWEITGNAERSLQILLPLLDSFTYDYRTVDMLAKMGPDAAPAMDALIGQLDSDDIDIRLRAAQALANIGAAAEPALAELLARRPFEHPDQVIAIDAAVGKIRAAIEQPGD